VALSINNAGAVTRYYSDGFAFHGFIRDGRGRFTSFDPPGSVFTQSLSINNAGAVTGNYLGGPGIHGFVRP